MITPMNKYRIKARLRKGKIDLKKNVKNLFDWIKGAELIELKECDTSKDPVRPELDNDFRTSYGRKIYGVKYKDEIHAVMCFAFTNKIPKTVKEDIIRKFKYILLIQTALVDLCPVLDFFVWLKQYHIRAVIIYPKD